MPFTPETALLIVDVQSDFCAGGTLAVPDGDDVVPVCNAAASRAAAAGAPVFASRDWHPAESPHFSAYGGAWPVHCVQGTKGARLHPDLMLPSSTRLVTKGDSPFDPHGYDAFDGHLDDGKGLVETLRDRGVAHLVVVGLATDYCVKNSVLGARRAGLEVTVLTDGIRGVNLEPGDSAQALDEMAHAGAVLATLDAFDGAPE